MHVSWRGELHLHQLYAGHCERAYIFINEVMCLSVLVYCLCMSSMKEAVTPIIYTDCAVLSFTYFSEASIGVAMFCMMTLHSNEQKQ